MPTPVRITDLAPDTKDEDKMTYIVEHADGTYEDFLILPTESAKSHLLSILLPKDIIVGFVPPLSIVGTHPEPPDSSLSTSVPSGRPFNTAEPLSTPPPPPKPPSSP